jgi:hypothetical protein
VKFQLCFLSFGLAQVFAERATSDQYGLDVLSRTTIYIPRHRLAQTIVLTRRAYRLIVRWLPIKSSLKSLDMLALRRVSRLINGLATPLLCRSIITVSEIPAIEKFVGVLR